MPSTKQECAAPSGTTMPEEATIKTKPQPKFYAKEPHLTHLDRSKLIVAAQYLLSGQNPPQDESDYFSKWVQDQMFEHKSYEQRDFEALAIDETDTDSPEGQRRLLELAIRECLEGVRTLPSFRNLNLTNGILQTYRRELTWLLGKWIECDGAATAEHYPPVTASPAVVRERAAEVQTLDCPSSVARYAIANIPGLLSQEKEHFVVVGLDARRRPRGHELVSIGTLETALVHPREVFTPLLRMGGCSSFVALHNHPSGDPHHSPDDETLTRRLHQAGNLMGIRLTDHVIVSPSGEYHSLRECLTEVWE